MPGAVACLLLIVPGRVHATAPVPSGSVRLSPQEHAAVVRRACGRDQASTDDQVGSWRHKPGGEGPINVSVACAAHRQLEGRPVRRLSSCIGAADHWRCEPATEQLDVTDGPNATRLELQAGTDARVGLGVLTYLLARQRFRLWPVAARVAGATCAMRTGRTGEIIMRCDQGEYWVSRDCFASGICRYRLFECNCDRTVFKGGHT